MQSVEFVPVCLFCYSVYEGYWSLNPDRLQISAAFSPLLATVVCVCGGILCIQILSSSLSVSPPLSPLFILIFSTPLPIVLSLSLPSLSFLIPSLSPCASLPLSLSLLLSGPEYQEVEVHLLREKTGFGFRILGGDEAVQAVSPDARDKARMGRAGQHTHTHHIMHTYIYILVI